MYYSVIKLEKDNEIFIGEQLLKVDVSGIKEKDAVGNDMDLISATEKGFCNWVSGGGTYLVNDRYLVVVKRALETAVNPGKFSLFTGRSDDHNERINPRGLVRELFEELILYSGDKFLYPKCSKYQNIIDCCYKDFERFENLIPSESFDLELKETDIDDRSIEIVNGNSKEEINLTWHVNGVNDVNVLFLFKVNTDIKNIYARDAEYHIEENNLIFHDRDVFLLDINTNQLSGISDNNQLIGDQFLNVTEGATEHLMYILNMVKGKVI
jgi:hypothetical protein